MNEMEMQLSRLFNAAVGEPPKLVTAHAARRQALKRRIVACIGATAALAIAGSIGLAVSANAIAPHRVTSSQHAPTLPKYYFDQDVAKDGNLENVVRSVATGAITARVRCPGPRSSLFTAAAADNQTFFIECQLSSSHRVAGTRIYRFRLTSAGRVTGFGLVRQANLAGTRGANMAASPDGSEVAIDVAKAGKGPIKDILIFSTKTGFVAAWHTSVFPGGALFHPTDLSFVRGGRELAVFGFDTCAAGIGSHCTTPGEEMRLVGPADKGGSLASGRRIFTQAGLGIKKVGYINDAFMTPDGRSVTFDFGGHAAGDARVAQLSAATGKIVRTLFRPGPGAGIGVLFGTDPSGQFVLYDKIVFNGRDQQRTNGWIDHGRLRPLQPVHGALGPEAW